MVTIKDMAEMLGISSTTVSNVIHGKTSEVSQKTVEKVEKLLEECDYVPNNSARSLTQNSSKIIGVALKSRKGKYDNVMADPFMSVMLGAIEAEIRSRGYYMMIYTTDDISELIRNILTWNVDGLLLIGIVHDDFVRIKSRYKKPVVLIDSYAPRDIMNYVNVGLEDERGGYEMTRHLLDKGHRRIAFLADNMEGVDYIRYIGHQKAFAEYGIRTREKDLLIIRPDMIERESSMQELYTLSRNYTAFMCCSDYYAVMLMTYFRDRGVKIPEDLSITGFDDVMIARVSLPALTTVHQNPTKKGRLAVDYLLRMVQGEEPPEWDTKLPVELVIRDSVKAVTPYGNDEGVFTEE
ncbi:LacI family DNA-binding transcriptional regulator [Lachnospiraceae bacterium MD308]|nr:LacI family DNA-binding transcriptional regulator [Lachnospiraceae bacterium MD308]MCI8581494.1 LacI family transcriptional regulator [Dorea sp.]